VDFHQPPQTSEWVIEGAILVLDVYRQMLDAYRQKKRATGFGALPFGYAEYFQNVVGVRAQFEKEAGLKVDIEPDLPAKNSRFTEDDNLVCEAVQGLETRRWPNKHQAAIALAARAQGTSETAIVRRLEGKISKVLETTRNNSKD